MNSICQKYRLAERKHIDEFRGEGTLYEHIQTGAKVFTLKNDDKNKVFMIGFRTTPKDSTGVAHIMEHSVLCGSAKYPLKDPFVELAKGSLNTFLNAMTFPDKTLYPIASVNDKDFMNLMDVYLDSVFHPNVYREPKIFRQEGWHYELLNQGTPE
jgi:Zn-dependent M16 (insulinase) family peptidase